MPNNRHTGRQNSRDNRRIRHIKRQRTYVIVTDGEKTEKNYFLGLKESLQEDTPVILKIQTVANADKLIEKGKIYRANYNLFQDYNPTIIWIVFDRDRVMNFDEIINEAKRNKFSVAWSNPCIEEWFWAYFEELGSNNDSTRTNESFKILFKTKTDKQYKKNMEDIYKILREYGDEEKAILRAERKLRSYLSNDTNKPSEMYSATTIFELVKEWRDIENNRTTSLNNC